MGATIQWHNKEKTVLYCKLNGNLHCTRFYTTLNTLWQGIASMPHKVDLVVDLREGVLDFDQANKAQLVPQWCPVNLGTVILIGRSQAIYDVYGAFMWSSGYSYLSVEVRVMNIPEAAYRFLNVNQPAGTEPA